MTFSPGVTEPEKLVLATVAASVLAVAVTAPGRDPTAADVVGTGFVLREDGLVATSWAVLAVAGSGRWFWAREAKGPWHRAIPLGGTWWADVGVFRVVSAKRRWRPLGFAPAAVGREELGERFFAIGCAPQRSHVATVARLTGSSWFDPDAEDGVVLSSRRKSARAGKRGVLVGLSFEDALSRPDFGGSGSPVLDAHGSCVGYVALAETGRDAEERILVRPASFARPVMDAIAKQASLDPGDLGASFVPTSPGEPLPEDIRSVRAKTRGGALVDRVLPEGPANGHLWEGDVVLEVDGRPVFGEVRESFALALLGLAPGIPVSVVVWRGGKPRSLSITPLRARVVDPQYQQHHDARAPGRLRLR